jgi:ABC-type transport system involved in Fe-S cluster assembly fused permease/ATPase subunit
MKNHKISVNVILNFLFNVLWTKQPNSIKIRTLIVILLVVSVIIANVSWPILFKLIIDNINQSLNFKTGFILILAYGTLWLFAQVFTHIRELAVIPILESTTRQVVINVYEHLNKLPLEFHLKKKLGNLVSIFEKAETGIPYFCYAILLFIIPLTFEVIISASILAEYIGFKYAVLIIIMILSYLSLNIIGATWQSKLQREKNTIDMEAKSIFVDRLINFESIKYLNRMDKEKSYFGEFLIKKQLISIKTFNRANLLNILQSLIIGCTFLYIVIDAGIKVLHSEISTGDFIMLNTYFIQLSAPLRFIGNIFREMKKSFTDIELIIDLSKIKEEKNLGKLKIKTINSIIFDNVCFGYENDNLILKNLSFSINSGEKIGIVGTTGSGKSTIIRLLYKFYKPISGKILINGINIENLNTKLLREKIGIIAQDTILFNDSIEYNLFSQKPNDIEMNEVLHKTKLDQLIKKLSNGVKETVGDRGAKLSGGEKQRIGIARILFNHPNMLICDEISSALDYKTERQIIEYLDKIFSNKIQIIIAHRLTTLLTANKIIYLENGTITETGTHKELLSLQGSYCKLWKSQKNNKN